MLVEDECQAKSAERAANTGRAVSQMTGLGLSLQESLGREQILTKEVLAATLQGVKKSEAEHNRLYYLLSAL